MQYDSHFEYAIELLILTLSFFMLILLEILKQNITFYVQLDKQSSNIQGTLLFTRVDQLLDLES